MATADSQQQPLRPLLLTMRTSAAERAHLREVAEARSTNVSDLIRRALAADGALPAQ